MAGRLLSPRAALFTAVSLVVQFSPKLFNIDIIQNYSGYSNKQIKQNRSVKTNTVRMVEKLERIDQYRLKKRAQNVQQEAEFGSLKGNLTMAIHAKWLHA